MLMSKGQIGIAITFSLLPSCLLLAALVEEVVGEVGVPGVQLAGHQLRERPRCLALRLAHDHK